jgi:hypothetical protein
VPPAVYVAASGIGVFVLVEDAAEAVRHVHALGEGAFVISNETGA